MSILVAMIGSDASVVATDSRRIESDGTVRDDAKKTFRLSELSVVGGHTGLLEFGGRSIPEWLNTISIDGLASIDEFAAQAGSLLETEMTKMAESEVGFIHRIANVALVGRTRLGNKGAVAIRVVELRPDNCKKTVVSKVVAFPISCTMGDPAAQDAVAARLHKNGMQRLPRKRLHRFVDSLVATGISASGLAPNRNVASCGGPAQFEYL